MTNKVSLEQVKLLNEERDMLIERLRAVNRAIDALRYLCEHDWSDAGHDSHHSYQKCKVCGLEEKA